jgi:tRNA threonylcarbamoyladenosine biosynthesis protein TsaE
MKKTLISKSPAETEALASKIAAALPLGSVVALHGDLGAGKTVFARGFARALGITEPITSPTFTIAQEYSYSGGRLIHLDLYRIDNADAALAFGVDEFLYGHKGMSLIEWPERITPLLPESTVNILIECSGPRANAESPSRNP